jgi:hypothetical protein
LKVILWQDLVGRFEVLATRYQRDGGLIARGRVLIAGEGQLPAFIDQTCFFVKEIGKRFGTRGREVEVEVEVALYRIDARLCRIRKKKPAAFPPVPIQLGSVLELYYIIRFRALGAINNLKGYCIPLGQGLEALAADGGKMDENVITILLLNEPKALSVIEPLDSALCHLPFLLCFSGNRHPGLTGPARRSYQGFWEQKNRKGSASLRLLLLRQKTPATSLL